MKDKRLRELAVGYQSIVRQNDKLISQLTILERGDDLEAYKIMKSEMDKVDLAFKCQINAFKKEAGVNDADAFYLLEKYNEDRAEFYKLIKEL